MDIKYVLVLLNISLMFIIMIILYCREKFKTKKLRQEFESLRESLKKTQESSDVENKIRQLKEKADSIINDTKDSVTSNFNTLSNRKIMEFEEYANQLFEKLEISHKEVVFLYDMLNDKSESIKVQFSKLQEAQASVNETLDRASNMITKDSSIDDIEVVEKEEFKDVLEFCKTISDNDENIINSDTENTNEEVQIPVREKDSDYQVQNEKIIKLYSLGYSTKEISKKLGIGIGEVSLVNNLYKNRVTV